MTPVIWGRPRIHDARMGGRHDVVMADGLRDARDEVLIEHARRAFGNELGAQSVDVWLGKDGVTQHDVKDLATIVVHSLEPILASRAVVALVDRLHREGLLAPPVELDPNE
jgi:hypothetical protein